MTARPLRIAALPGARAATAGLASLRTRRPPRP